MCQINACFQEPDEMLVFVSLLESGMSWWPCSALWGPVRLRPSRESGPPISRSNRRWRWQRRQTWRRQEYVPTPLIWIWMLLFCMILNAKWEVYSLILTSGLSLCTCRRWCSVSTSTMSWLDRGRGWRESWHLNTRRSPRPGRQRV